MTQRELAKRTLAEFLLWARSEGEITTDDDGLDGDLESFQIMADKFLTHLDNMEIDVNNITTSPPVSH